jgi:putative spermidine/putrescine transport system substrate-binding protein
MTRTICLGTVLATVLAGPVAAEEIAFTAFGGESQEAVSRIFQVPFTAETGIVVNNDTYTGGWGPIQAMVTAGDIKWDVLHVESPDLARGCQEGVFQKIDWTRIDPNSFIPNATSECGVGNIVWAYIMAFDPQDYQGAAPATAADFFDLQGFPGNRGMLRSPRYNLEFALLADGVAPEDVYDVLSTPEGVDRAFAKLDTIKESVRWWEGSAQSLELLNSGETSFSMVWNGRIPESQRAGRPILPVWDSAVYGIDSLAAFANGPNPEGAMRFLEHFANNVAGQAEYAGAFSYGPTLIAANELLSPEVAATLPSGANITNGLYLGSDDSVTFWLDRDEDLTARFVAWIEG